ncbi:unnamed protein product [Orchesella dallaii]|uniref:Uncharacterized protein n=1 Tax=Orchesella dallaii TaxID=48710 RepID=A0ABP1R7J7_9HEXA
MSSCSNSSSLVLILEWLFNYTLKHMLLIHKTTTSGCSLALIHPWQNGDGYNKFWEDCTVSELMQSHQLTFFLVVTSHAKLLSFEDQEYPDGIGMSYKFHPYCRIVISDYSELSRNVEDYHPYYFKNVFRSYYFLFKHHNPDQDEERDKNVTKTLKFLPNTVFMSFPAHLQYYPLSQPKSNLDAHGTTPVQLQFSLFCRFCQAPNWHRKPLIIQVTQLEILAFAYLKKWKLWTSYTANIFYEVGNLLNATLKINQVQKSGSQLDLYVEPLIQGTSHLCSVREEATSTPLIYYSTVVYYDTLMFITAKPEVKVSNSLFILIEPFSPLLWLTIITTLIFTALTAIIHLSYKIKRVLTPPEMVYVTWIFIGSMVKLAVDQQLRFHSYKTLSNTKKTMFVLCVWFLSIIILSCGYKSKIISEIITPSVEQPPKTFKELAFSDFKKHVMLVANEEPLPTWNTTVGRKIRKEWRKHAFIDDVCYREVLKSKSACIGWGTFFQTLGRLYLTGANGQQLFSLSDNDGLMSVKGALGVSKQFPELLGIVNKVASWQLESGMRAYFQRLRKLAYNSKGKALGKKLDTNLKYYHLYNPKESITLKQYKQRNLNIKNWLLQVLLSCYIVSLIVFSIELIGRQLLKIKTKLKSRKHNKRATTQPPPTTTQHDITVQFYTYISVQQKQNKMYV